MSTADGRNDSGLVRPDGSLWGRREFVTAMGAGVVGARYPGFGSPVDDPLLIKFHGVLLVTKGPDANSTDIWIPLAETSKRRGRHDDRQRTKEHKSYLVEYPVQQGKLKESLLTKSVTITSQNTTYAHSRDVGAMFAFDKFASEDYAAGNPVTDLRLRPYTGSDFGKYFAARITLRGGELKANPDKTVGSWGVPPVFVTNPISPVIPATALWWYAKHSRADVSGLPGVPVLDTTKHGCLQVGHQREEPEDWGGMMSSTGPKPGVPDDDFKWLYSIVVPTRNVADEKPWEKLLEGRRLPVPTFVKRAGGGVHARNICIDDAGPGTPTCFGGCFGCT